MAKQKEEQKPVRINRNVAANQVVAGISGKTTLGELATKADELFVQRGGKSDPKAAANFVKRALDTAEAIGAVKLTRPTDTVVEKTK